MIGKTVAHYKIVEKIGAGGMGEVYRAADSRLGRDVALKILPPTFAEDAERLARFRREARLLAQLNHRNIGAIYGFEETADVKALVLELVEGPSLADRMAARRVPVAEALTMALQIAEAVEAAHESGVVHRDLKPSNVKLTPDGQCKVLDFGLAKALEGDAPLASSADSPTLSPTFSSPVTGALTGHNVILGTAAYMSPEQARGRSVDKRADIWAFGVILFEMLAGRSLFAGETVSDTLAGVLKTDPPWDALPPDTPRAIVRLVRRCLERDPRKRLRDIGDARIVIEEALGEPVDDAADRTATPAVRSPSARRLWRAPALILLGAFVGAAIVRTLAPAPERPVRRFLISSGVASERPRSPRISPDGRRIAYVVSDRLYIRDLDRIEPHVVENSEGAREPFWSPDGSVVGFHRDGKLWKADAAGGPPTTICDLQNMREAHWHTDGTIVFDSGRSLRRVSARGGEAETIGELPQEQGRDLHGLDVLPGDRGYVVVAHYDDQTNALEVWSRSGEHKRLLAFKDATLFRPRYSESGFLLFERTRNNEGVWALPFSLSGLEATDDPFLVVPEGIEPSVSQDGTLVSVPGSSLSDPQLAWVELDGSAVTSIGQQQEAIHSPRLSADGSKVVVVGEEDGKIDLWVHDIERSTKTRLTFAENDEALPIWSADGRLIYYTYEDSTSGIFQVAADGSGEPEKLTQGGYQSISADGQWMAFERDGEGSGLDLWKWSLGGTSEPEVFLATPADEENIRLSPDGRWAAYESDESGRSEIYVKPFPAGSGRWQVSVNGGRIQRWSLEGDRLFFVEDNKLYRVEVETKEGFRLSSPEQVVDGRELGLSLGRGYAVAPGGNRIVAVWRAKENEEDAAPRGLLVVQNWLSEF